MVRAEHQAAGKRLQGIAGGIILRFGRTVSSVPTSYAPSPQYPTAPSPRWDGTEPKMDTPRLPFFGQALYAVLLLTWGVTAAPVSGQLLARVPDTVGESVVALSVDAWQAGAGTSSSR